MQISPQCALKDFVETHKNNKLSVTCGPLLYSRAPEISSAMNISPLALAPFHVNHETHSKQENVSRQTQIDSVRLKRNDFFYLFFIFLRRLSL